MAITMAGTSSSYEGLTYNQLDALWQENQTRQRIERRYRLQDIAVSLLPNRRALRGCGRWVAYNKQRQEVSLCHFDAPDRFVAPWARPVDAVKSRLLLGKVRGLQSCSSPHICPVCAPKLAERRVQIDLAPGLSTARGLGWFLLTVTSKLRHKRHDNLSDLMTGFVAARRRMTQGGDWSRFCKKYGYEGTIRAYEITYGVNGYHPHYHDLFVFNRTLDAAEVADVTSFLKQRWSKCVVAAGLRDVTLGQGLDVSESHVHIEEYIQKQLRAGTTLDNVKRPRWDLPQELGKQTVKAGRASYQSGQTVKGYSMFELLSVVEAGVTTPEGLTVARAAACFQEFDSVVTKLGIRQLRWSPGLKAKLGVKDLTDIQLEALDETESQCQIWARLAPAEWQCLSVDGLRGKVVAILTSGSQAELNEVLSPYVGVNVTGGTKEVSRLVLDDKNADDRDRYPLVGQWVDPLGIEIGSASVARALRRMHGAGESVYHFVEKLKRRRKSQLELAWLTASWNISRHNLGAAAFWRVVWMAAVGWDSEQVDNDCVTF